jgi:hypothetical protein
MSFRLLCVCVKVILTEAQGPRERIPDFGDCNTIGAFFFLFYSSIPQNVQKFFTTCTKNPERQLDVDRSDLS